MTNIHQSAAFYQTDIQTKQKRIFIITKRSISTFKIQKVKGLEQNRKKKKKTSMQLFVKELLTKRTVGVSSALWVTHKQRDGAGR